MRSGAVLKITGKLVYLGIPGLGGWLLQNHRGGTPLPRDWQSFVGAASRRD